MNHFKIVEGKREWMNMKEIFLLNLLPKEVELKRGFSFLYFDQFKEVKVIQKTPRIISNKREVF